MSLTDLQLRQIRAAEGYLELDVPRRALEELEAASACDEVHWQRLRAEALRRLNRYDEAIRAFRKVMNTDPGDLHARLGLAWCYKRSDRLGHAIAMMRETLQHHPRKAIVLYNLACYQALDGQREDALSNLARAIRTDQSYRKLIDEESDFDSLRDDPDFQFIVGGR